MTEELICKGSWVLKSACGKCRKCAEEAQNLIPRLLDQVEESRDLFTTIAAVLPETGHRHDVSDSFKLKCFEEARRLVRIAIKQAEAKK